ncbi:hypothetical protein LUX09_33610 [Streptomyces albogriseolus]|nr:hypothetical protein [Streptomyces albogriseolus]
MALVTAERELGRRLQLVQGIHWLYGAQGDAYAALLRGYGSDPSPAYERARAAGPLWRSKLGVRVCTGYAPARRLLAARTADGPGEQPQSALAWDQGLPDAGELPGADRVREPAARAAERALAGLRGEVDLVASVAARVPVEVLADVHGLTGADRVRLAEACAGSAGALDAALAPPAYDDAVRLLDAVGALRDLLGDEAARAAVVGVRAARELIAGVLHALLAAPEAAAAAVREDPALLVTETLRHDPPVKLHTFSLAEDVEAAGERVAAARAGGGTGGDRQPRPGGVHHARPVRPGPLRPGRACRNLWCPRRTGWPWRPSRAGRRRRWWRRWPGWGVCWRRVTCQRWRAGWCGCGALR